MSERWPGEVREDTPEDAPEEEPVPFDGDGAFETVPASREVAAAQAPQHVAGALDIPAAAPHSSPTATRLRPRSSQS